MSTPECQSELQVKKSKTSDEQLENDPRFLRRIAQARASLRAGRGVPLEGLAD